MMIAAIIGNINCTIGNGNKNGGKSNSSTGTVTPTMVSVPLYRLKRDLLWCLYDGQYINKFPFALIELGDCEDHCCSSRGETVVKSPQLSSQSSSTIHVLQLEQLFLEAISSCKTYYNDSQTYPYFYAGHYHKDAGLDLGASQEYRLVEAIRLYAQASRVASTHYIYDSKDSLYLMKHMTIIASLIYLDILTTTTTTTTGEPPEPSTKEVPPKQQKKKEERRPRTWAYRENAIAAGTWLLGFYDSLFFWEEKCGQQTFVEICTREHKYALSNLFQTYDDQTIRQEIVDHLFRGAATTSEDNTGGGGDNIMTPSSDIYGITNGDNLVYFTNPRSMRLKERNGLLIQALTKKKVTIGDLELAMISNSGSDGRRAKRARKQS